MARLERLLNLAAALSTTSVPLTFRQIRERVPGYGEGEAGRRAFERDKEQLRDLGFDLRPEGFDDGREQGYRLRPDDWSMRPLDLLPEEVAALGLAAHIARIEGEGPQPAPGMQAAARLVGFVPERPGGLMFSARLGQSTPHHAVASDAVGRRRTLRFGYRSGKGISEAREVEPYALVLRNGHWYVAGHDRGREAIRAFRLDRIEGDVDAGEPGGFERPADFDPEEALPPEPWGGGSPETVRIVVHAESAWWVRPQLGRHTVVTERPDGSVVVDLDVGLDDAFVSFVASLLDVVEVVSPPQMREAVVRHVEAALESHAVPSRGPASRRPARPDAHRSSGPALSAPPPAPPAGSR